MRRLPPSAAARAAWLAQVLHIYIALQGMLVHASWGCERSRMKNIQGYLWPEPACTCCKLQVAVWAGLGTHAS